jgi:hypothetical protein
MQRLRAPCKKVSNSVGHSVRAPCASGDVINRTDKASDHAALRDCALSEQAEIEGHQTQEPLLSADAQPRGLSGPFLPEIFQNFSLM